ncbi:MAG: hypothetical protein M1823_002036 [Watsoniomyces obsoletus]|nr:MAG: hypothetical protein M1823_002036 [Watsoniomyces obsoletus]
MTRNQASRGRPNPRKAVEPPIVTEPPKFDLETYIANYTGRTRYARLRLISCCSTVLAHEASKAAVIEAKQGRDVARYQQAVQRLQTVAPNDPEARLDEEWIENTTKAVNSATERMGMELKGYKNNLIKESIRMGNEDLAQHYQSIGDLPQASQMLHHMRDYCTSPKHIADMSLKIIQLSIEQRYWITAQAFILKIRNLQLKPEESVKLNPKLTSAMGLTHLSHGQYRAAALAFISTPSTLGNTFNSVISANDIATYGGLCALASLRRDILQQSLERGSFRTHLELEPHIRRAITFFCSSRFSQCLEILQAYRNDFLLDIYLRPKAEELLSLIRVKCIVESFTPFKSTSLKGMAESFRCTKEEMEGELIGMIRRGVLNARIDGENDMIISQSIHPRNETQKEVLKTLNRYEQDARLKLMTLNIATAWLEVKPPKTTNLNHTGGGNSQNSSNGGGGVGGGTGMSSSHHMYNPSPSAPIMIPTSSSLEELD